MWTFSFETWWLIVLTAIGFALIVYPILIFFEHFNSYSKITTERKKGELKSSLIIVFVMYVIVISVAEGIFKDRWLALASIYAWGTGDAFAALIGKKFGRHKLTGRYLSGKKSIEGTVAMFFVAFLSVFIVLLIRGGMGIGGCMVISALTAAVSAMSELYTPNGLDTISCPLASLTSLIILLSLLGGL